MIDQGSSELNIIIGVANEDFETAIKAIYDIFVLTKLWSREIFLNSKLKRKGLKKEREAEVSEYASHTEPGCRMVLYGTFMFWKEKCNFVLSDRYAEAK